MVLSNGQRQTGGQTTGWGEASRVTPRPPAHGWWDQELPSRIEGERPGQERERLLNCPLSCTIPACHLLDNCQLPCV